MRLIPSYLSSAINANIDTVFPRPTSSARIPPNILLLGFNDFSLISPSK